MKKSELKSLIKEVILEISDEDDPRFKEHNDDILRSFRRTDPGPVRIGTSSPKVPEGKIKIPMMTSQEYKSMIKSVVHDIGKDQLEYASWDLANDHVRHNPEIKNYLEKRFRKENYDYRYGIKPVPINNLIEQMQWDLEAYL